MTILRETAGEMDFDDVAAPGVLDPVSPGEILAEEFMRPLGLSARALSAEMGVPPNRITGIINGVRGITADTAIRLGRRFGNSARFWMNVQIAYDLAVATRRMGDAA